MSGTVGRVDRGLRSVRLRLTATAVIVVAIVLAVTGVVLVAQQRSRLVRGVDDTLRIRADDVVAGFEDARDAPIAVADVEDQAAQVVDADGVVLASTANLSGEPPIAAAPDGAEAFRTIDDLPIEDDEYRVLSRRVGTDGLVVHVAENVDDVTDSTRVLVQSLLVAFPLVLAALGALTWWLVGRTLRPVRAAALRQERFVSDASHELRSPLARMRARLEVDLTHPEGVDLRETAGEVLGEAVAMERLVDDLLHVARQDAGVDRRREVVDLDDLVLEEAAALRSRSSLTVDVSQVSGATVDGHRPGLVRLVRNLVDNAGHHAVSTVRLSLVETGELIRFVVDDDGPGIAPADREAVFDRFARVDLARAGGGTGLGLAIARDVVAAHSGTITIGDAELGGARLEVVLPGAR